MSTATEGQATDALVERFGLKTLVECCLVLEEGIAGIKDIDDRHDGGRRHPARPVRARRRARPGRRAGGARARRAGVGRRVRAAADPASRLVSQGRLGKKSGQGFFPYPQPDSDQSYETIALETRGDIGDPVAQPAAGQPAVAAGDQGARRPLAARSTGRLRAVVVASSNPFTFSAGRRHQGVHEDGPGEGRRGAARGRPRVHDLDGEVAHGHDRGGQLARVRRRLRAGDGVRLPHRGRVGDVRPAGDQPGHHPGLRRHAAAAAAGRRGQGARDEPARRRDRRRPRRSSTAWSTRSCRTTSCSTPPTCGRARWPSRPRSRSRRSSRSRTRASSARVSRSRASAFGEAFGSEDAKEGIGAFLGKRQPNFQGK